MGFVQETARMLFGSMFHLRVSDFLSNINSASKLPVKPADKTAERVSLSFFPFLSLSCILQCVTGRSVGRQIQKCVQMSHSITGAMHSVFQILFHSEATPCRVRVPCSHLVLHLPCSLQSSFQRNWFPSTGDLSGDWNRSRCHCKNLLALQR